MAAGSKDTPQQFPRRLESLSFGTFKPVLVVLTDVRLAWLAWAFLVTAPLVMAAEHEGEDEGEGGEALGVAAAWALGIAGGTALLNLARRRLLLPRLKGKKEAILLTMRLHRKVWLPTHLAAGIGTVVLGTLHGLAEEEGNWMLWGSMVVFGFLVVGGAVLAWKWTPASVRKGVYLLHSQQILFLGNLVLLFVGHALGDD